jgi:hypothetical protein
MVLEFRFCPNRSAVSPCHRIFEKFRLVTLLLKGNWESFIKNTYDYDGKS